MSEWIKTMTIQSIKEGYRSLSHGQKLDSLEIQLCSGKMHGQLSLCGGSRVLLVNFHGAVDRKSRQLPVYQGTFPIDINQLSLSDPSLNLNETLSIGWYAGNHLFDLQRALRLALAETIHELQIQRVIFIGSSAGGFAALYYSSFFQDSICIAINPQTNIMKHYVRHITEYRRGCWPNLNTNSHLNEVICSNVCDLYRGDIINTVIYIQNFSDGFHLTNHFLPFLASLATGYHTRIIPHASYWGTKGHARPPNRVIMSWVSAAVACQNSSSEAIIEQLRTGSDIDSPEAIAKSTVSSGLRNNLDNSKHPELIALSDSLVKFHSQTHA